MVSEERKGPGADELNVQLQYDDDDDADDNDSIRRWKRRRVWKHKYFYEINPTLVFCVRLYVE